MPGGSDDLSHTTAWGNSGENGARSRHGDVRCVVCGWLAERNPLNGALPKDWRPTDNGGALCVRCVEEA